MRTGAALLLAVFASVALGVILAFAGGGMSAPLAIAALVGGAATGALAWRQMPREPGRKPHPAEWLVIGVFAFASLRAFLWVLYVKNYEYHILSPNNLGDMPLHLDFIRYLASGVKFWPGTPIFVTEPLTYPIGADFFNSLLLLAGLPIERGLLWAGLLGSLLTGCALWRWGRGFAIAAFVFGGGLSAFALFAAPSLLAGPERIPDYQATQTWKNLFLALFVTQRGLLFALPAGLFLLDHWRARYLRGERGLLPTWAALLLYGALPLFNVHAFLYLSIALAGMFLFARDSSARRQALLFVAAAFVPATVCVALVTGGFSAGGIHLQIGWMQRQEDGVSPWWFWFRNFGLYLVLAAWLAVAAAIRGPRELRAIVLPAAAMFVACAFVSFAAWAWDNTKILLWCWLAVAPAVWSKILRPMHIVARAAICFVLFFTGAVSLVAGLDGRHGYGLVDLIPLHQTAQAVRDIPPDARFASASERAYLHPLLILGRKIAMGFPAHLESHGITYQGRNRDKVRRYEDLMLGDDRWLQYAQGLGIGYIYWGPMEEEQFPMSVKPWEKILPVVGSGDDFKIYKLSPRPE